MANKLAEQQRRQDEAQLIETARGGMWPEAWRAFPNYFGRSDLFAAVNLSRKERKSLRDVVLHSQNGLQVRVVSGEELDQADLDVLLGVLHLTREQLLKEERIFRVSTFLKKVIGKTDCADNRNLLHRSLKRLRSMSLEIRLGKKGGYVGGLLSGFDYLGAGEGPTPFVAYRVFLDPRIACLFKHGQYSLVHWEIRKSLRGKPIAQWPHCFCSSHLESVHHALPASSKAPSHLGSTCCALGPPLHQRGTRGPPRPPGCRPGGHLEPSAVPRR
ncbi:MAG: hypothetical protein AAF851_17295 [Myxococcota bacterium]